MENIKTFTIVSLLILLGFFGQKSCSRKENLKRLEHNIKVLKDSTRFYKSETGLLMREEKIA